MKRNSIDTDIILTSETELHVIGMGNIRVLDHGDIRERLKRMRLPDGTFGSLGRLEPVSFYVSVPFHHTDIINYMNLWFQAGQDPIIPLVAYVPAMLKFKSSSGKINWTMALEMVSLSEKITSGHKIGTEKMSIVKYKVEAANVLPPLPF